MPWNPQGGGGGPWGGGGGQGPWGRGPSAPQPPDIEELLRKGQDRFKQLLPGGLGSVRGLVIAAIAVVGLWLASGFYKVEPDEQGVVLLFGRWAYTTNPGLNWYFPAPIGQVLKPKVQRINSVTVGYRGGAEGARTNITRDVPEESSILTGDQNIADVDFNVFWRIKDAGQFLFNMRDPAGTVKVAAESAMREVIGQTSLQVALTGGREQVQLRTRQLLQDILDSYGAGITITQVQLLKVDPPSAVIDAFNEVQRARQDKERKQNEAEAYRNKVVPTARGEAERLIQEATAYRERMIREAEGEAKRFISVLEAYRTQKDVARQRLYLERMQEVLRDSDKVIIDKGEGSPGVVPYLPLPELKKQKDGGRKP